MRLTREAVEALIPHRTPFLFVESAELIDQNSVRGTCRWPTDNPVFKGHFPDLPIVPGVLAVDAVAQLAGTLLVLRAQPQARAMRGGTDDQPLGVLIGIKRASFHRPILPESRIQFDVKVANAVGGMVTVDAVGHDLAGQKVCKCELSIAMVDRAELVADVRRVGIGTAPAIA